MQKPFNLTFAVGPTQISKAVQEDAIYAFANNLLSVSHRGAEFTEISKNTVEQLRIFLNIPQNYEIFFTSSATEAWEICAKNLVEKEAFSFSSGHFSGAFSQCLEDWSKKCTQDTALWGEINNFQKVNIPNTAELVTICHNETSTGVTCNLNDIKYIREKNPEKIIAVDITSSVGCAQYNIIDADVWYFSIQKGFGLPSGLGVMAVSTKAIKKSQELLVKNHQQGFFNFSNMQMQMAQGKYQTISTPNILAIYLLGEQTKRFNKTSLSTIEKHTKMRANRIYSFFEKHIDTKPFIKESSARSPYSLCIEMSETKLKYYTEKAMAHGIQLGGGYGKLKKTCMRISNYPSIKDEDIEKLFEIFTD